MMNESSCESEDSYEIMYLSSTDKKSAQSSSLARHALPMSTAPIPSTPLEVSEHIKVGTFYEIDQSELPPQVPEQLKLIRVVMVSEKAVLSVSLRFPSIHSLRTHLNADSYGKPEAKKLPALDEKYVMASEMAAEVLFRRVRPQELAERRNSWSFWVAPSVVSRGNQRSPGLSGGPSNVGSKRRSCLSELKLTGMVQWGKRRKIRFLDRKEEYKPKSSSSTEKEEDNEDFGEDDEAEEAEEQEKEEEGEQEEEEEEEAEEEEEGEEEEAKVKEKKIKKGGINDIKAKAPEVKTYRRRSKRKLHNKNSSKTQNPKPAKRQKQNQIIVYNRTNKKKVKNSIDRWSAARYKLAEENMLKIMKAKGAVCGKPILRPALRSEARKLIGDTGLLDHLLKHMAGKVAPGGTERFRRRHNADGAMEYWLEDSNLVNVRREAGVQDPYWIPPPGWQPGDNPAQDPVCARELKELREEMSKMKKDMRELASRKQDEDLIIVAPPNSTLTNLQWNHENSAVSLKELYVELVTRKAKMEEQLKEISESLRGMEEQMGMLKSTMGEHSLLSEYEAPALIGSPTTPSDNERETRQKNKSALKSSEMQEGDQGRDKAVATIKEDKAAKIQRLKSGFSICKPQGSFMWPNPKMTFAAPQLVVQVDDPFMVPTPPSVSSSTGPASRLLHPISQPQIGPQPTSPVKPLAEKGPVCTATLSTVSKPSACASTSPTLPLPPETSPKSSLINLNEAPPDQNDDTAHCGTLTTYQRRHHIVANIDSSNNLVAVKKEDGGVATEKNMGEAWWAALATRNPCLNISIRKN